MVHLTIQPDASSPELHQPASAKYVLNATPDPSSTDAVVDQQRPAAKAADAPSPEAKYLRSLRSQSVAELNVFFAARAIAAGEAEEGSADEAMAEFIKLKRTTRRLKKQCTHASTMKRLDASIGEQNETSVQQQQQHDERSDEEAMEREASDERKVEEEGTTDKEDVEKTYLEAEKLYGKSLSAQLHAELKLYFLARNIVANDRSKHTLSIMSCVDTFMRRRDEATRLKSELAAIKMARIVAAKMVTFEDQDIAKDAENISAERSLATTPLNATKVAWEYYRDICGLVVNRWTYEQEFSFIEKDPLYYYLMSCSFNDGPNKQIDQQTLPSYADLSKEEICADLVDKAGQALPKLVGICKDIAKKLGLQQVGMGPVKEVSAAMAKAERKYNGDIYKVTDFCRTFLIAKDVSTLLAIIEYSLSSHTDSIKRIKLSPLKNGGDNALEGGYRDCKINIAVDGHIGEIQVHLERLWDVTKVDGYQEYKKCLVDPINSFNDPYRSLLGLTEDQIDGLIIAAAEEGLETQSGRLLKAGEEVKAYFALAGILIEIGEKQQAQDILGKLHYLKLKTPDYEAASLNLMYKYLLKKTGGQPEGWVHDDSFCVSPYEFQETLCWITTGGNFDSDHEKEAKLGRQDWLAMRAHKFKALSKCDPADEVLAGLTAVADEAVWLVPESHSSVDFV